MRIIGPDDRLYVVVGVVSNASGQWLLQQRPAGKPCAYQWEFPGGKVEDNESPYQALSREMHEELGISIHKTTPLTHISQDYAHARVWLDVYVIESYSGEVTARENQQVAWLSPEEISRKEVLPPVYPILDALEAN